MSVPEKTTAMQVENLGASYGANPVLANVNFKIQSGQTYGLIGLNGVGKTTLIKIALGLKQAQAGGIRIFGVSSQETQTKQDISYLPERFDPPWFLKGDEFILFSASLYGRKVEVSDMVRMAESLALDPAVLKNRVQSYSKGMRQKLGLIAAVLTGCKMLILDEPMSGLDPLARSKVKDLILSLKAEGRTVILSSHILSDMDEICDEITVINGGTAPFTGTPEGLKNAMSEKYLERAFLKLIHD